MDNNAAQMASYRARPVYPCTITLLSALVLEAGPQVLGQPERSGGGGSVLPERPAKRARTARGSAAPADSVCSSAAAGAGLGTPGPAAASTVTAGLLLKAVGWALRWLVRAVGQHQSAYMLAPERQNLQAIVSR